MRLILKGRATFVTSAGVQIPDRNDIDESATRVIEEIEEIRWPNLMMVQFIFPSLETIQNARDRTGWMIKECLGRPFLTLTMSHNNRNYITHGAAWWASATLKD